jgi:uncharacterized protein (TIGR03435 family)
MPRCSVGYRPGGIALDGVTMFSVAEFLSLPLSRAQLGNITVDQTGLTGRYTMDLDYQFGDPTGPSLSTAVREQWGLRIVPSQGPFKAVIIERAQLPTEN